MKMRYEDLIMEEAETEDVPDLLRWWNDGKVMAHAGFPKGLGLKEEDVVRRLERQSEEDKLFILRYKDIPVGEASYRLFDDHGEIGIKICETSYQEKGYGRLYLSMLCERIFEKRDLITLDTDVKNARARHVYEMLGFQLREIREAYYKNDQMEEAMDVVFYEMRRGDFRSFLNDYYLIKPDGYFAESIRSFRKEYLDIGKHPDGSGSLLRFEDPEKWIADNLLNEDETMMIAPMKVSYQYVYVERKSDEIVGMIQLRPDLSNSPFLAEYGGHIGYCVRPSRWNEGIGERMFRDLLPVCRDVFHMDELLVTCLRDNEASRKIILSNGGIHERDTFLFSEDQLIERYLIPLSNGKGIEI